MQDISEAHAVVHSMGQDIASNFPNFVNKSAAGIQKPAQANNQTSQAPDVQAQGQAQAQSTPLNAANLQQQQQALNKQTQKTHQRSNSRNNVPAAPTSAHPPPFPLPSEHSTAPKYFSKTELTQDNLRLPTSKRQKQSATSTPQLGNQTPGSTSSPQVIKAGSPELKKQNVADQPMQDVQQNKLHCPENDCDHHFTDGFDTSEELEKHRLEEHDSAMRDPPHYLLNGLAKMLDLDADGKPKTEAVQDAEITKSKSGATPTASSSANKQASVAGVKSGFKFEGEPVALQQPPVMIFDDLAWANASVNPLDLMHNFQKFESGANGAISDMGVYRAITPNDTPESSKSNNSEPNSDISDGVNLNINIEGLLDNSWQPFGAGVSDIDDFLAANLETDGDMSMMAEYPPYNNDYKTWDDFADPKSLEQPFVFDTTMFNLNEAQL